MFPLVKKKIASFLLIKRQCMFDIEKFNGDDYTSIHKKTDYDAIIITYHGSSTSPYASNIIPDDIVREIDNISKSNNVILNLFLNPYSLNSFKSIDNFESIIISYQNNMISQEISADLMIGARTFKGKIPVSNNFFKVNHGLSYDKKEILVFLDLPMRVLIRENFNILILSQLEVLIQ